MRKITFLLAIATAILFNCNNASAQRWAVGLDVADMINLGTISIDGSVAIGQHITINAEAAVNPWTFNKRSEDQFQNRKQTYSLGVRYWLWNTYSGWWTGAKLQYREYNRGGIINDEAEEGNAYGLGVNAGYSLMLSEHFNMEFGLGLWGGYRTYTTYACPSCGKVTDSVQEWFMASNELLVSLVWLF